MKRRESREANQAAHRGERANSAERKGERADLRPLEKARGGDKRLSKIECVL